MSAARRAAVFPVLGRSLWIGIHSEPFHAWLRRHWYRPEHTLAHHPFELEFAEQNTAPAPFEGQPRTALLLDFEVEFLAASSAVDYREAHWGVQLELNAHGAATRSWGIPRSVDRGAHRFWAALQVAFHEALRASGLLPFHAAVVVRDGGAVALAGPSGAGKSTTLLRAIRAGEWAVLAEDLSWLDPETLVLYGWDPGLRIWADSIEQFAADLAHAPWSTDARGKRFLPWDVLDAPLARAARLDTVLLLNRGDAVADRPVQQTEAVKSLWEATGVPLLTPVRRQVARSLATVLERIRFGRHVLGEPLRCRWGETPGR